MPHITFPFCLAFFTAVVIKSFAFDIPHWAYHQKAGELDTGCMHNLTLDNHVTDQTFTSKDERAFLMDLFHNTDGQNWRNKSNWGDINIHHCQWAGVQCYPNNSYVKWIHLVGNDLKGPLPNFWKFRNLQGICLSHNTQMTGSLSGIISPNMTRLRRLSLSFGDIEGDIPWEIIFELKNLEKLQICCMAGRLYGTLPPDIGKLYKLQVLSLGENDISGDLPLSIGNLTKLWFLDLEYVRLGKGNLSYMSGMTQLEYLHMMNCKLTGGIPKDFGRRHPKLMEISLFGNKLEGSLTGESLTGFNNLQHLSFSENKLGGLLPQTFKTLHSLKVLDLSHNNFSGFEENMTFNANLEILNLGGNKFMNTSITHFMGALQNCKNLRVLNASNCSLKGELPSAIWDFAYLTYLDLNNNELSGKLIPASEYSMLYLFHLNLASNNLSGKIDTMAFFAPLKALTYLNIKENPLLEISLGTYLKPKYEYVQRKHNYSCPSIEITSTRGIADMDAKAYKYSLCFCNDNFYGYSNYCLPCKHGGVCQKEASSLIVRGEPRKQNHTSNEVKLTIMKGYWPCGNGFHDVQRLVKCSKKATHEQEVCNPSGNCRCRLMVTAGSKLKTSCNTSCVCSHGNTGRFCSKCIANYYKKGDVCVECPEFQKNFPVVMTVCFVACLVASIVSLTCFRNYKRLSLIMMGVLVLALIILHISSIIPGWFFIIMSAMWIVGLSTESQNLQSFLFIAVFYFQSLDAMLSEANIWPKAIILLKYKLTNVFNFEFAQLTCSFSGVSEPYIIFAIVLLLPLGGIVMVWLAYMLSKAVCGCISSSMCKRLTIQVLLLIYFPIAAKSFSALTPCDHRGGLSFLKDAPWLDCHGTSYDMLKILGYISLVGYVIGIPLFIFLPLLLKYLDTDGNPVSEENVIWLKPLYEEFKQQYHRWFPLIFLARRLLLAVMLSLVPKSSCYQILGITLLLLLFIILVLITRPYEEYSTKFEFENMADVIISVVLLLSFVGLASVRKSHADESLVSLILALNLVVVFFCAGGILLLFAINLLRKPDEIQVPYEPIPG